MLRDVSMWSGRFRARTLPALSLCLCVLGCAAPETTSSNGTTTREPAAADGGQPTAAIETATPQQGATQAPSVPFPGYVTESAVRTVVLPIGNVPYDQFSLPLIDPLGRYVATQTGEAPDWSAVLADPEFIVPLGTGVDIYQLTLAERTPPAHYASVEESVVLGRACDADGFLVEWPRDDGSRWIGKVRWHDGEVEWLVQNEAVNAFACLGPDGRLAWSRRSVNSDHFDLVVQGVDGRIWSMPAPEADWLLPTWSGKGDGLFLLRLQGDQLDLVHAVATTPMTFRQSLRRFTISSYGSVHRAFQAMNGQPVTVIPGREPATEQIVFFHPAQGRVAVWQPRLRAAGSVVPMRRESLSGLLDGPEFVLVATADELWRQSLESRNRQAKVLKGMLIPRRTAVPDWPVLLLTPREDTVGITALNLLPVN